MGYTTDFTGRLGFTKPLTAEQVETINDFNEERHEDGTLPGYYCQWNVTEDGYYLEWDGGEKFYNYTEWLVYLINHYFEPWGIKLNGTIRYQGEEIGDSGEIQVESSNVQLIEAKVHGTVECPHCGERFTPDEQN